MAAMANRISSTIGHPYCIIPAPLVAILNVQFNGDIVQYRHSPSIRIGAIGVRVTVIDPILDFRFHIFAHAFVTSWLC